MLSKMSEKIFPNHHNLQIFPIKTVEELKAVDGTIENVSEHIVVSFCNYFGKSKF